MALVLFTDFGSADLYVGQVKSVVAGLAPRVRVIDALHDAPDFRIAACAHLLAALAPWYPRASVFMAIVDPGVGGPRDAIAIDADGRTFVGPDNGLLSVLWQRAARRRCRRIAWRPQRLSDSFHGRDLFAPVAARIAARTLPRGWLEPKREPDVLVDPRDLAEIIYIDHYGNAITGVRAASLGRQARMRIGGRLVERARTFEDAPRGASFWHANSQGLVEIAANQASAARRLRLRVGTPVELVDG